MRPNAEKQAKVNKCCLLQIAILMTFRKLESSSSMESGSDFVCKYEEKLPLKTFSFNVRDNFRCKIHCQCIQPLYDLVKNFQERAELRRSKPGEGCI